jgi:hypothetical protein
MKEPAGDQRRTDEDRRLKLRQQCAIEQFILRKHRTVSTVIADVCRLEDERVPGIPSKVFAGVH